MQEQPGVTWDLNQIDTYVPLPTKLYVCFLLVCCIWGVTALLKFIWKTRAWPSTRRGELFDLSQALQTADASRVSDVAAKISEAAPGAGLQRLAILKSVALHELPAEIIARADLHFTCVLSALHVTANNLRSLRRLLLILMAAWTAYGLANICKGISYMKATGISAVYGGLTEVLGTVGISLFILAVLYALRWRIVCLLDRRERLWLRIKGQLAILFAPPR